MNYAMLVQALIGLKGQRDAKEINDKQYALLRSQLANIANIPLPELERIEAEQLGPSAMEGIRRDEGLRHEQMANLEALRDIVDGGGLSLGDRVGIEQANQEADKADRRRRASILAELAGRGQLDSGATLVSSLSSAQDAANRGRASGQEAAARAEARKMEALRALSQGAGQLRSQDFGEEASKAQARDEINRWNAAAREKSNYYNAGLAQQHFGNQMARATGQQPAAGNLAAAYANEAQGVRGQSAALGQGLAAAINGAQSGQGQTQQHGLSTDDAMASLATSNPYPDEPAPTYDTSWSNPYDTNDYDIRDSDDK